MVEQDPAAGVHVVRFPVVPRQLESADLADAVTRSGVKGRRFSLGNLLGLSEHLAGSSEINAAMRGHVLERPKQKVSAVDIRIEGREFVVEGITYEALRCQVVTLVRNNLGDHLRKAGVTLD